MTTSSTRSIRRPAEGWPGRRAEAAEQVAPGHQLNDLDPHAGNAALFREDSGSARYTPRRVVQRTGPARGRLLWPSPPRSWSRSTSPGGSPSATARRGRAGRVLPLFAPHHAIDPTENTAPRAVPNPRLWAAGVGPQPGREYPLGSRLHMWSCRSAGVGSLRHRHVCDRDSAKLTDGTAARATCTRRRPRHARRQTRKSRNVHCACWPHVNVHVKAEPLGVEGLGPADVTDGHLHELEQELEQENAGTHRAPVIVSAGRAGSSDGRRDRARSWHSFQG